MKRYRFDFRGNERLTCWHCGEECNKATLIEWNKTSAKEILCHRCLGQLVANGKDIKRLGEIFE